ncbi:hypothetical protein [Tenacibaculum maritimum]|uniref:hypothetical protein n=1 Tax=Tenacibaculum maritimum TaxID=107401 RepID=UPI0012E4D692|nr:hypothetical protein [Tenacibaculum maritimum]CAA0214723.1 conserved hypothetical protein [Tenacibaculum maritimum]CAA0250752.1 conserved hypothetical protein [Tenacibaculum maritimum]
MLRVYHRIKINKELLNPDGIKTTSPAQMKNPFGQFLKGYEKDTIPAGKVVGVTWNPYPFEAPQIGKPPVGEGIPRNVHMQVPTFWSQTDIRMLDSKGREITVETDISDYRHKSGGHIDGFKNIHMDNKADAEVRIEWETIGTKPICGEFVFIIEQENCEC